MTPRGHDDIVARVVVPAMTTFGKRISKTLRGSEGNDTGDVLLYATCRFKSGSDWLAQKGTLISVGNPTPQFRLDERHILGP